MYNKIKVLFQFSLFAGVICLFIFYKTNNKNYIPVLKPLSSEPSCEELFKVNTSEYEIQKGIKWNYPNNELLSDNEVGNNFNIRCKDLLNGNKYILNTNDNNEKQFKIAYSIITFKNAMQVERLLRTIYRPWNYYCIHVDLKSDKTFFNAIEFMTNCLGNIYGNIVNTKNRVNVEWGEMSVLTADLNCMKELHSRYNGWKYFINLTGQEFPLKTNRELVYILKSYNGANNLEGTYKRRNENRVSTKKMPFPLTWYKGSVHITANWDYVNFIFTSPKVKFILEALHNQRTPDEQFFATLNFNANLQIPGSFIGDIDDETINHSEKLSYFYTRFKNWGSYSCLSNNWIRSICIWGVADLPKLIEAKHLFANKFHEEFQPATLRCLEKWYYEKVKWEILTGTTNIDTDFYKSLVFVINQYRPPSVNNQ